MAHHYRRRRRHYHSIKTNELPAVDRCFSFAITYKRTRPGHVQRLSRNVDYTVIITTSSLPLIRKHRRHRPYRHGRGGLDVSEWGALGCLKKNVVCPWKAAVRIKLNKSNGMYENVLYFHWAVQSIGVSGSAALPNSYKHTPPSLAAYNFRHFLLVPHDSVVLVTGKRVSSAVSSSYTRLTVYGLRGDTRLFRAVHARVTTFGRTRFCT